MSELTYCAVVLYREHNLIWTSSAVASTSVVSPDVPSRCREEGGTCVRLLNSVPRFCPLTAVPVLWYCVRSIVRRMVPYGVVLRRTMTIPTISRLLPPRPATPYNLIDGTCMYVQCSQSGKQASIHCHPICERANQDCPHRSETNPEARARDIFPGHRCAVGVFPASVSGSKFRHRPGHAPTVPGVPTKYEARRR